MVTNNSSDISHIGHYEVTSLISTAGGFGVVYKGRNILSPNEPEVAIKLLRTHLPTEEDKKHFQEEVRIHEKLNHKYILRVVEVGFQNGLPYLITEYAINGSLQTLLKKNSQGPSLLKKNSQGPLPLERSLTILSQIGQALYYAHNQEPSIVHSDIKPDNILFNSNWEALLADFGIAKALDEAKTKISDSIAGTRPYMAPELFKGIISVKSDQYALGCLAYELFTGKQPITLDSSNDLAWAEAHKYKVPIPPTQLNLNVPPAIEQAVLKAMAKERDERHRDISEFLQALVDLCRLHSHLLSPG